MINKLGFYINQEDMIMQEIICILDGSGSMGSVAIEAKNGFNKFIEDQKAIGDANITIVWFDDKYSVGYEGKLSEVSPLDEWKIGGMTALYDAVGKTFSHVKDRFSKEKPEKVVLAIQTDGMENASKEFTSEAVKGLISEHESKYGWTVIFMGAGLDAANQAMNIGVRACNTIAYDANQTMDAFDVSYSTAVASARN